MGKNKKQRMKNTRSKVFKATRIHSEATTTITAQPHKPVHDTALAVNFADEMKKKKKKKKQGRQGKKFAHSP